MATKAIVGEKVGMTQVWDDQNRVVPVTVVKVAPCRVVQVKTPERDGYSALQVTFGYRNPRKLTKIVLDIINQQKKKALDEKRKRKRAHAIPV